MYNYDQSRIFQLEQDIETLRAQRDEAVDACRDARNELNELSRNGVRRSATVMNRLMWVIDNANNVWQKRSA